MHVYNCGGKNKTTNMLMTDAQTEIILSRVLFTELPRERACLAGRDVCNSEANYKSKRKKYFCLWCEVCASGGCVISFYLHQLR